MAELPPEMIIEILSHCPVKTLFRLKAISPDWLLAINSDPYLISQQHNFAPPSILIDAYTHLFDGHLVYSYGPGNEEPGNLHRFMAFAGSVDFDLHDLDFMGSPNGVVCAVRYPYYQEFTLWNPATGSFMRLPAPTLVFDPNVHSRACVGVGFVPSPGLDAGEYKAIRILEYIENEPDEVEILSVNLGQWERMMTHHPRMMRTHQRKLLMTNERCYVAKGVPYWKSKKVDPVTIDPISGLEREKLVWFDWGAGAEGSFRQEDFAWPTEKGQMFVDAMNDCLCAIVTFSEEQYCGLWVKEGEGTVGWIHRYNVVLHPVWLPIGFYGTNGIVLQYYAHRGLLWVFDLERAQEVGQIILDQDLLFETNRFRVLAYTESLTDPMRQRARNLENLGIGIPQ